MLVYLQYILLLVIKKGKEEETKMLLCQGSKLKTMTAKIQPFFSCLLPSVPSVGSSEAVVCTVAPSVVQ